MRQAVGDEDGGCNTGYHGVSWQRDHRDPSPQHVSGAGVCIDQGGVEEQVGQLGALHVPEGSVQAIQHTISANSMGGGGHASLCVGSENTTRDSLRPRERTAALMFSTASAGNLKSHSTESGFIFSSRAHASNVLGSILYN